MANITINLDINSGDVNSVLNRITSSFDNMSSKANKSVGSISKGFSSLTVALGGILTNIATSAFTAFTDIGKNIFNATASFEKYNAVLTSSFGSQEAANVAMEGLQKFAAKTPFTLDGITQAYVSLVNRGLVPGEKELTAFGDFASKSGKDLKMLTEAIMDIGNQERWSEFGVKASKVGNKLKLTFNGITKEADYTTQGAAKLIEEFGLMEGTAGLMSKQAETLGGKYSNLEDSLGQLAVTIGKQLSPILGGLISKFTEFITKATPYIQYFVGLLTKFFGETLPNVFNDFSKTPAFQKIIDTFMWIYNTVNQVVASIISIINDLYNAFNNLMANDTLFSGFIDNVMSVYESLKSIFTGLVTLITGVFGTISRFLTESPIGRFITDLFMTPLYAVWDILQKVGKAFTWIINGINEFMGYEAKKIDLAIPSETSMKLQDAVKTNATNNLTFDKLGTLLPPQQKTTPVEDKGKSITGGQTKSIVLNIGNVIETVSITQNQDPFILKDQISRVLLTAIADAAATA